MILFLMCCPGTPRADAQIHTVVVFLTFNMIIVLICIIISP